MKLKNIYFSTCLNRTNTLNLLIIITFINEAFKMTERVSKTEMVKRIQASSNMKKRDDVNLIINCFIEEIGSALSKGERVDFPGFGSFSVSHRAERKGRNPQTGEEITIAAHDAPVFKAGKDLKSRVKEGI